MSRRRRHFRKFGKVLAVAWRRSGCSAGRRRYQTIRPIKTGVISDFDITGEMLKYFIRKVHNRNRSCGPDSSSRSRHYPGGAARGEGCGNHSAAETCISSRSRGAAIGTDCPFPSLRQYIVDIGGGTTDIAVISMDGVVYSKPSAWRRQDGRGDHQLIKRK